MFQEAEVETDEEEHDFQMRMATAMSLSASEEPSLVHSQHQSAMPSDLVLKNISPNGWCFYDCVREHLHCNAADGDLVLTTPGIAALCLSCLALHRQESSDFVEDSEAIRLQRRQNIFQHDQYLAHIERLNDFEIYVLDKLEALLTANQVVDTRHYADAPEIEAFLGHFGVTMLRVRPANEWNMREGDIGAVQGLDANVLMQTVTDEVHLRNLLQHQTIDLQLMHYQYATYEHYDIVHLLSASFGIAAAKKAGLTIALLLFVLVLFCCL